MLKLLEVITWALTLYSGDNSPTFELKLILELAPIATFGAIAATNKVWVKYDKSFTVPLKVTVGSFDTKVRT